MIRIGSSNVDLDGGADRGPAPIWPSSALDRLGTPNVGLAATHRAEAPSLVKLRAINAPFRRQNSERPRLLTSGGSHAAPLDLLQKTPGADPPDAHQSSRSALGLLGLFVYLFVSLGQAPCSKPGRFGPKSAPMSPNLAQARSRDHASPASGQTRLKFGHGRVEANLCLAGSGLIWSNPEASR